jgi:hypothetical protein
MFPCHEHGRYGGYNVKYLLYPLRDGGHGIDVSRWLLLDPLGRSIFATLEDSLRTVKFPLLFSLGSLLSAADIDIPAMLPKTVWYQYVKRNDNVPSSTMFNRTCRGIVSSDIIVLVPVVCLEEK